MGTLPREGVGAALKKNRVGPFHSHSFTTGGEDLRTVELRIIVDDRVDANEDGVVHAPQPVKPSDRL